MNVEMMAVAHLFFGNMVQLNESVNGLLLLEGSGVGRSKSGGGSRSGRSRGRLGGRKNLVI